MRVLFCGLGSIGQRHLRAAQAVSKEPLDVHAYRVRRQQLTFRDDMSVAGGVDVEREYGITTHLDLAEALAAKPDAAFICNPSALHVPVAMACVRAGVDVFMEKPLSHNFDGVGELAQEVRAHDVIFQVGLNYRYHPALQALKSRISQRQLGAILHVYAETGEYLPNWHKYEDYRQMYAARSDQGGGVILTQIHELDILYWLFGLPGSVVTHGGNRGLLDIDVEDCISSLLRYSDDLGDFSVLLHQDFLQKVPARFMRIAGDAGIAEVDLVHTRLRVIGATGEVEVDDTFREFSRQSMFEAQAMEFLDCVRSRRKPALDLHEGTQSLRLAMASLHSLKHQREIRLEEVPSP